MRRREVIAVAGGVGLAGVAGCSGGGDGSDDPAAVVEEFYETAAANSDDPEAFADEAAELAHSESPLRRQGVLERFIVRIENGERTTVEFEMEDISTEVVDEDLGRDEITSRYELLEEADVDGETLESVAQENASVETVVEMGDGSTRNKTWLVTKEDGEWVIFI